MDRIRIGTRGSKLALKQAALVQEALLRFDSGAETEIVVLHTKGDRITDRPLAEIGDKGIFVSEFEQALLEGKIDVAVHSAKDLPMKLADGLAISAVLARGDVRDVLVVPKGGRMPVPIREDAAEGETGAENTVDSRKQRAGQEGIKPEALRDVFIIGSGSRRRQAQARSLWSDIVCEDIRGNVDTRLRKLKDGSGIKYDGIILAKAGLDRLEIERRHGGEFTFYPLAPEAFLPAACQGIIAVEALQDCAISALCGKITDRQTELCFLVEREALAWLAADCSEAAAAWCRQEGEELVLDVMYAGSRKRLSCKADSGVVRTGEENGLLAAGLKMAKKAAWLVKGQDNI